MCSDVNLYSVAICKFFLSLSSQAQYVFIHKAMQEVLETDVGVVNGGLSQTGFSQSGTYPSVYVNREYNACIVYTLMHVYAIHASTIYSYMYQPQ